MLRPHWLGLGLAALVLLALNFLLTGGVYRTVNAGGGRVYVVNRFTGKTKVVRGDVMASLKSEAEANRAKAAAAKEQEKQAALRRERDVATAARAADADYVGDLSTHLYHKVGLFLNVSAPSPTHQPGCLADVASPVYFDNALEATGKGYWPCQKCLPSARGSVRGSAVPVRAWPRPDAPVSFTLGRKDTVTLLGGHGDYYAMSTERIATGERGVGWVASSDVELDLTLESDLKRFFWRQDADDARQLRARGKSVAGIAEEKGWKADYVSRLLAGQEPEGERQSVPGPY